MTSLQEKQLKISFPQETVGRKFDDQSHGLSHCMKAVDFILKKNNRIYFIEIKDPDNTNTSEETRKDFKAKLKTSELCKEFVQKFRDSFLYEWASDQISNEDIFYLVILAMRSLTKADLITLNDELKRKLPLKGPPSGAWKKSLVAGCGVFNLQSWNENFPDFQIERTNLQPDSVLKD